MANKVAILKPSSTKIAITYFRNPPGTPDDQVHTLVNNGLGNPNPATNVGAIEGRGAGGNYMVEFYIDEADLPSDMQEITKFKIAFQHIGAQIVTFPEASIGLKNKIGGNIFRVDDLGLNTNNQTVQSQIEAVPVPPYSDPNELFGGGSQTLSVFLDWTLGTADPTLPNPYEEPTEEIHGE